MARARPPGEEARDEYLVLLGRQLDAWEIPTGARLLRSHMQDAEAAGGDLGGDGPEGFPLCLEPDHAGDGGLLGSIRNKAFLLSFAQPEAKWPRAAEEVASRFLIGFDLRDALSDSIALRFDEGGGNRQE